MSQRFARYSELISPILSFGCEGWALSWSVMSDLHTFEGGLLRRIAQFRKPPTITLRKHLQASAKRARTFFMTGGHKKIEEIVLKNTYSSVLRVLVEHAQMMVPLFHCLGSGFNAPSIRHRMTNGRNNKMRNSL